MNRKTAYFLFFLLIYCVSCKRQIKCDDLISDYSSLLDDLKNRKDTILFVDELKLLIAKDPACMRAYHLNGFIAIKRGDYKEALSVFQQSLNVDPASVYSLYNLAYLYNIEGENESAYKYINIAIKSKLKNGNAIDYVNFFSKDFDIELSELLFIRGVIFFDSKNYENAKKDFLTVAERKYNIGEDYIYLANTYFALGKRDSSCFYLKRSIGITSPESISLNKEVINACSK